LYNSLTPKSISVEPEPKFQVPAPSENVWPRLQPSKIGLRLHSPGNSELTPSFDVG